MEQRGPALYPKRSRRKVGGSREGGRRGIYEKAGRSTGYGSRDLSDTASLVVVEMAGCHQTADHGKKGAAASWPLSCEDRPAADGSRTQGGPERTGRDETTKDVMTGEPRWKHRRRF